MAAVSRRDIWEVLSSELFTNKEQTQKYIKDHEEIYCNFISGSCLLTVNCQVREIFSRGLVERIQFTFMRIKLISTDESLSGKVSSIIHY